MYIIKRCHNMLHPPVSKPSGHASMVCAHWRSLLPMNLILCVSRPTSARNSRVVPSKVSETPKCSYLRGFLHVIVRPTLESMTHFSFSLCEWRWLVVAMTTSSSLPQVTSSWTVKELELAKTVAASCVHVYGVYFPAGWVKISKINKVVSDSIQVL